MGRILLWQWREAVQRVASRDKGLERLVGVALRAACWLGCCS